MSKQFKQPKHFSQKPSFATPSFATPSFATPSFATPSVDPTIMEQFQQFQQFQQMMQFQNQHPTAQGPQEKPKRQFTRHPKPEAPKHREVPQLTFTQICDVLYAQNKNEYLRHFPDQRRNATLFAKFCDHHGYFVKRQMFDDRLKEFQAEVPISTTSADDDQEDCDDLASVASEQKPTEEKPTEGAE